MAIASAAARTSSKYAHPIANMRTHGSQFVHIYTNVTVIDAAVRPRRIKDETEAENATAARIKTKDELLKLGTRAWAEAADTVEVADRPPSTTA
jgi:hypothetical protein